ncbi:hypothetical protein GUJ93_ZPchr0011g27994 [Zizania palustris]|uniref:Uncharacterized protein n=1 Tax=Zizania palustris TaxID=103762 RepID=A0A8J5WIR0_ZIZPA|nr:hypothetical protein GUJ93_ZPchr0011g27994 [Zizania palustris]
MMHAASVPAIASSCEPSSQVMGSSCQPSVPAIGSSCEPSAPAIGSSCEPSAPAMGSSCQPSVPAMGNSGSSWVVEIDNMIDFTELPQQRAGHSIYRGPKYIKDITNPNAYRPKLVSLGPFHHGDPVLLPMEAHKRRAVVQLVKRSGKPLQEFIAAIEKISDQLHEAYENLDETWNDEKRFVELMVTDGCFFLEVMMMCKGNVEEDYGCLMSDDSDPNIFQNHFSENSESKEWESRDTESEVMLNTPLTKEAALSPEINNEVQNFLEHNNILTPASPIDDHLGLHPLDILLKSVRGERPQYQETTLDDEMMHPASVAPRGRNQFQGE